MLDPTTRFQLSDDLLRRFGAALRGGQLYAPSHPIVMRNLDAFNESLRGLCQHEGTVVIGVLGGLLGTGDVRAESKNKKIDEFIAAAGTMAHYVGDACQPLHGSQFADGFKDESGKGVHSAYETNMIDDNAKDVVKNLRNALGTVARPAVVKTGQEAAVAVVRLMDRAAHKIDPTKLINAFIAAGGGHSKKLTTALFTDFGVATGEVMADGVVTLAMLWESAWENGGGNLIPDSKLQPIPKPDLQTIYEDQLFVPSKALGQIDPFL